MDIKNKNIDDGTPFDWGRTSKEYAKYRDIYPPLFYQKIVDLGLCTKGQRILDIGTGTGVLPRNMYAFGGKWTGIDISKNQIEQAKRLSNGMDISFFTTSTEAMEFPLCSFDVITACQCFWYFDHENVHKKLHDLLKPNGRLLLLCMEWLPFEDKIAGASEKLILKYSPNWSGAGETMHPMEVPDCYFSDFELVQHNEYKFEVPFTRESWNGRLKACRGIGASLTPSEIAAWEKEHMELLHKIAPEKFTILHYAAMVELKKK